MGYYTLFEGAISIEPPIDWKHIKDSPFIEGERRYSERHLTLRVQEVEREIDGATYVRKYADAVVPCSDDSYKGYDIVEHFQELLDTYGKSHSFKGFISASGENTGDMWRLASVNGEAVKIEPQIVWPEMDS